ncbi:DUF2155 domain-containing protein [Hyphomonas sp.]|uniref:DUF2155 domain-containing protein n=1 Tax=Hyphomonas sp. TaxID=87 RepID=UPI0034A022C1
MKSLLRGAAIAVVGFSLAGLAVAATYAKQDRATLRALDKITGRSTDIVVKVGEPVVFGSLSIDLKRCFQTPPEEVPESAAFLRISSTRPVAEEQLESSAAGDREAAATLALAENPVVFSGWMYASSPGLSALEHPVYDIWVIRCTAPAPVKLPDRVIVPLGDEPLVDDMPAGVAETDEAPVIEDVPAGPEPID